MREVVFDTETTGLSPAQGHRLVEVGCVELMGHLPTGRSFQRYINPERDMPDEARAIHGLSAEFLAKHKVFAEEAGALLDFIGDSPIVAHNADFDMGFLNAELTAAGLATIPRERAIDTVLIARRRYPGSPASLDALCKRFNIDLSARNLHGALLDAQLLAQCYVELIGAREPGLQLAVTVAGPALSSVSTRREPKPHAATAEELETHAKFAAKLKNALWLAANG